MPPRKYQLHNGKAGAAIAVRVTPRSSRNEISEVLADGTVKIRLTAAPVEGQANEALIRYLSRVLDVPASQIEIVAGQTGKDKLVTVTDVDSDTLQKRILELVSK
jgi:uncharacterized protein (TIGR00251 family)